jgi:hypothetical protein
MAPLPPAVSAVPVAVSVIRAYWQSACGNAITGSEVSAESIHCFFWQRATFVAGILSGQFEQGCSNDGKVFDVCPKEIAKADKRLNSFDIGRWFGIFYCF